MADKIQIRKGSVGEPLIVPLYGRADNGTCRIYNLDFSDVIKCRNEIIPQENDIQTDAKALLKQSTTTGCRRWL